MNKAQTSVTDIGLDLRWLKERHTESLLMNDEPQIQGSS